jgi:polysaccharide export outer membrane protein
MRKTDKAQVWTTALTRPIASVRYAAASLALAATIGLASGAGAADYRLAIGDTLEISAVGLPELKHRVQVNPDGEVSLPLGGQIRVSGSTLAEVRAKVRALLPTKEFRRRNEEGREYPVILTPAEIDVAIAEYRPIYLSGDVAKPGEQTYRPGMTVRQAVALGGGYDIMRLRMNNPFLEQAELRSEYNSLWTEFAREQVRISRLDAELNGATELNRETLAKTPTDGKLATELESFEARQLTTRNDDYHKEKTYLSEALSKEDGRIANLTEQNQKEKEGAQADAEDLSRVQELFRKGNVPITRVVESRRSLLLASTRQLQTASELAQVERQRQEFGRRSERLDDQRRLEILRDLADAKVRLAGIRSKLEAASEKLVYVGMVKSQLVRGNASKPQVTIYRRGGDEPERLAVGEDADLLPGDVVEVALQTEFLAGLPAR